MRIHPDDEIQSLIDDLENMAINIQDEADFLNRIHILENISEQRKDTTLKLVAIYHKSDIPYKKGDKLTFQNKIQEALNLAKEINQTYYLLRCYNSLAIIDSEDADYYSSISNYLQALHIANLHPEYQYSAILLNNIGNLFVWMNEHEKALDYLLEAVDKYNIEKVSNPYILNMLTLNIVEEYSLLKQYNKLDKWLQADISDEYIEIKNSLNIILSINEIDGLYAKHDLQNIHSMIEEVLDQNLKYDNYIYVYRSYMRLLQLAIIEEDKKTADLTIFCMDLIEQNSHMKTFKYDYAVLKYQYYKTFLEDSDDGIKAKELLKDYFDNSQNVIEQLRNTYTRRLVIESELFKVRYEKESAEKYNTELKKEIELDFFTNIFNKVSIEKYITQELLNKEIAKHVFLLIDIDHFKEVNDTYGHDYGDEIILRVVDMINSHCSSDILFGRFGGDEFILFVKELKNKLFLTKLIYTLLEEAHQIKVGDNSFITLSVGAYFIKKGDDFNIALNQADKALYKAKGRGRNQFYIINETDEMHS